MLLRRLVWKRVMGRGAFGVEPLLKLVGGGDNVTEEAHCFITAYTEK